MRSNRVFTMLLAVAVISTPALVVESAAGSGCSKSAAKEAVQAQANGQDAAKPCCAGGSHADNADGAPCCLKSATEAAVLALQQAETDCPKAKGAVEAAIVAVNKTGQKGGCPKSNAAAQQAALVAMKDAADATGCSKAKAAVEAVLVAANQAERPEARPTQ